MSQTAENKNIKIELVSDWWPVYVRTYLVRASVQTRKDYDSLYRNLIAPEIGGRALKSVRPAELQTLLNNLSTRSASYVRKANFLLAGLFRTAEENDLIERSPFRGIVLPDCETGSRRALTASERALFLDAAARCGEPGLFCLVTYYTGMRPSEVSRIRGTDIDREQHLIHVRGTKTKAAMRDVPLPDALDLPERSGLIFRNAAGTELSRNTRQLWWEKVRSKMEQLAGRPVAQDLTAYCLRHDYCTRLSEAGIPIETASRIMGHSDIQLTAKIYQHENRSELTAALSALNSVHARTDSENKKARNAAVCNIPDSGASERIRTSNLLIRSDVETASEEYSTF